MSAVSNVAAITTAKRYGPALQPRCGAMPRPSPWCVQPKRRRDPTAECQDRVHTKTRCASIRAATAKKPALYGPQLCHDTNRVCVECLLRELQPGRPRCLHRGWVLVEGEVGVARDARLDILDLIIDCWNSWNSHRSSGLLYAHLGRGAFGWHSGESNRSGQ